MRYPEIELDGAVVAVTGGARGIGKATSDLFTARGATVCAGDLDGAPLQARRDLARLVRGLHGRGT